MKPSQRLPRGGFGLGVVVGLLVGLSMALAVALYITRAPIPFVNKVPPRTAEQDTAEAERNRNWDPNAPLGTKLPARPVTAATAAAASAASAAEAAAAMASAPAVVARPGMPAPPPASASAARATGRDPAAILAGAEPGRPAADPFIYFVQAGAFSRSEEAEQQRARLAIAGHAAKITEREQAGRTVYRVRLGPLRTREDADGLQLRLQESSIESQIVRVERQ